MDDRTRPDEARDRDRAPHPFVSRRTALRLGSGGLVAALVAEGLHQATTAQSTVSTVTVTTTPAIVANWINAWNSSSPATAVAALYTADGVYEDVPSNTAGRGSGISSFLASFLRSVSNVHLTLQDAFGTADWAAAEYLFTATNQGFVATGIGKTFSVRTATIFRLRGNQITRSSDYYDVSTIVRQLAPPPAVATPRPATPISVPPTPTSAPTKAPTKAPTAPPTAPPTSPPTAPPTSPASPAA